MSKVLVIGGAGFIGSNMTELLVEEGHDVAVMDNLFLGDKANLKSVENKICFINEDFSNTKELEKTIKFLNIDYVYHFGGFSSGPHYDDKEVEGFQTGLIGYMNLLEACKRQNVKKVIYASSSSIYGNSEQQYVGASVTPPNFYAANKYFMEHISRLYYDNYGVNSIGYRFFSVYGPHEEHKGKYANLITQFKWAIEKDEDVVIYGDGEQTRDFTYVKDICRALYKGMGYEDGAEVFNIGTGQSYTLNSMIDKLETCMKKKAKRKYVKNPIKNYVQHTKADTVKMENFMEFEPLYSLDDGLNMITR